MNITYGNREGQYFTQWRFDLLEELLGMVHMGPIPGQSEVIEVEEPNIWYDAYHDFHHLSFRACGRFVEVWLYKVFSSRIDGVEAWVGCPRSQVWDYSTFLRQRLINPLGEAATASKPEIVREISAKMPDMEGPSP